MTDCEILMPMTPRGGASCLADRLSAPAGGDKKVIRSKLAVPADSVFPVIVSPVIPGLRSMTDKHDGSIR